MNVSPSSQSSPHLSVEELALRRERVITALAELQPEAGGLLAFGRVSVYYLTGTMGSGIVWLPVNGEPLLLVRKGIDRARLDSPCPVAEFRSYREIATLAQQYGTPLTGVVAAEQAALPWSLSDNLQKHLPGVRFVSGDMALSRARALKTAYELDMMREAGRKHAQAMERDILERIRPGMSEMDIARTVSDTFYSLGSCGICRMSNPGQELFLGSFSVGDNGNFPTFYNGPLGGKGVHPAVPYLGHPDTIWQKGQILAADTGFNYSGYTTDKTVCYFAGKKQSIPPIAQKAHDLCRIIEESIAARLRPGAVPMELYAKSLAMADEGGFREGFMGLGKNKVVFVGHGIGLCVDDWPVLASRFARPLEQGMTLAIEPKIGIPGIGMVGTENTWLVDADGGRCLTGTIADFFCVE